MLILTGQTLVQLPFNVDANGNELYFRRLKSVDDDADRSRIRRAVAQAATARYTDSIHTGTAADALQRVPESAMPRRSDRPCQQG